MPLLERRNSEAATKISAVILARNEENTIGYCLETLCWCDEIVVVDMQSEDRTVEIARRFTSSVFSHNLISNFDRAKKYAVEQCTGDWVLLIDADEMVSHSLALVLRQVASDNEVDIVEIPFRHYILGDCVNFSGWGYTPLPRFFRKGAVFFTGIIHDYMHCSESASVVRLASSPENCIIHFNYRDATHFVEKLNRYTSTEALNLFEKGVRFSCSKLILDSVREFYRRYIPGQGYREGVRGFALCLMMAFYRMLSLIKLWELNEFRQESVAACYEKLRLKILEDWHEK